MTEARNAAREMFSVERLLALLGAPAAPLAALLAQIEADVRVHVSRETLPDDVTLLALNRLVV